MYAWNCARVSVRKGLATIARVHCRARWVVAGRVRLLRFRLLPEGDQRRVPHWREVGGRRDLPHPGVPSGRGTGVRLAGREVWPTADPDAERRQLLGGATRDSLRA